MTIYDKPLPLSLYWNICHISVPQDVEKWQSLEFVILWKYSSLTEVSNCYKNDKLCQIFGNGVLEYFFNFQNVLESGKPGRYLELVFVRVLRFPLHKGMLLTLENNVCNTFYWFVKLLNAPNQLWCWNDIIFCSKKHQWHHCSKYLKGFFSLAGI